MMKNNSIEDNLGENEDPIYPMKTRKQPIRSKCSFCLDSKPGETNRGRTISVRGRSLLRSSHGSNA
ncbi:hypothetical protein ISN45_Aa02g002910 [Arabidopsis thaliana x Arabidopsis arenosa]|uniref:Uncharacterized protein n=1 Tax=Arabidopsis thaliana x Arabidopsis arenosa TaxID=1240361 RepID=A0A8T2BFY1_9BRAS|nr:hypothetical protein ISN45_Aa02g002910 [Arabidopsis thaliana x Arabidopsis arenosa]